VIEGASIYYHEGFFLVSSLESCLKLARHASTSNKTYAVNISAEFIAEVCKDALSQVMLHADFIFCNDNEARKFAQVNGFDTTDIPLIARRIAGLPKIGRQSRTVVVTQGARATTVASAWEVRDFSVPKISKAEIIDTNGAGDCKRPISFCRWLPCWAGSRGYIGQMC
jgi:adenosine kinase